MLERENEVAELLRRLLMNYEVGPQYSRFNLELMAVGREVQIVAQEESSKTRGRRMRH
jgi:hypothetical protein